MSGGAAISTRADDGEGAGQEEADDHEQHDQGDDHADQPLQDPHPFVPPVSTDESRRALERLQRVVPGSSRASGPYRHDSVASPGFDLFIIGAGSGGVRAARMAAQRGARVAVAEDAALGGTCVNLGCIPKKLYSFAAHYAESFEEARGFGWSVGAADASTGAR